MHVRAEPVGDLHLLLVRHHVGGVAGQRIAGEEADHAAHLELRIVLVCIADGLGAGHEHMVQSLEPHLLVVRSLTDRAFVTLNRSRVQDAAQRHHTGVDLVEGQPVLDLIFVALEDDLAVVHVELDEFPAGPAVVFFDQRIRQFVVADGDQRFDAVLFAAIEHLIVKFQTLFVGLRLHARGENAGPVDGSSEGLEAHLSEQGDVLFVVVVEINGLMAWIEPVRANGRRHPFGAGVGAVGAQVRDAGAFAVHIPCAFELVGGTGAAPQEIIAENAHSFTPLSAFAQRTASMRRSYWRRCRSGSAPVRA